MKIRFVMSAVLAALVGGSLVATQAWAAGKKPAGSGPRSAWREYGGNPIIRIGQEVPFLLWNDPSVLKEGETYRMWLSGGDPRDLSRIVVKVYTARSKEGISWKIDPEPCLEPASDPREWDSLRIETPSVIKVDGTYHLYYSGTDEEGAKKGVFAIGHATSADGVHWKKDPGNPIVTRQARDRFQWGYSGAGEPGAGYDPRTKTFYLYYVSMRFMREDPTKGQIGILLATSKDGSRFVHHVDGKGERAVILTRIVEGAISGSWFGYSTPSVLIRKNGEFHMFCDFLVAPKGPATARQVTLVHAVGTNGTDFKVLDENVLEAGKGDWKDQEVRAPSALEVDGRLKIWFAGQTQRPHFGAGIGLVERIVP